MGVYKISARAESDLAQLYEYVIEIFGLQQARRYLSGMHDLFQMLADKVNLGRDASEFVPSLKRFSYKSHTIFYLTSDNGIFIIRVLSQRMDYGEHL